MTQTSIVQPTDAGALKLLGTAYWLDQLQPLMGVEGVDPDTVADLRNAVVIDVDRVRIATGTDFGCSPKLATILEATVAGSVDGATLLELTWAAYMLSLKATMDAGKNRRAHIGRDPIAIPHALAIAAQYDATATPCDEVYGSDGTYLEALDLSYDAATRTLTVEPIIGS